MVGGRRRRQCQLSESSPSPTAGRGAPSKRGAHGATKLRPLTKSGRLPHRRPKHQHPPLRRSTGRRPVGNDSMSHSSHSAYAHLLCFPNVDAVSLSAESHVFVFCWLRF